MIARAILCGGALLLGAVAGCGDDAQDRTREARADRQRWARAVDTACAKAARDVVLRGRPASGDAVPGLVDGAIGDARAGIEAVGAVRRPGRLDDDARAFLDEMRALDEPLVELAAAARRGARGSVESSVRFVRLGVRLVRSRARDAGLRDCARLEGADAGLEAIEALGASRSLATAQRRAAKRLAAINAHPPRTLPETVTYFDRIQKVLRRLGHDLHLPTGGRFEDPAFAYIGAVDDAYNLCAEIATRLEQGKVTTVAAGAALDRRLKRAGVRMDRAYVRLQRAIRQVARPLIPDPPGESTPGEPEET